MSKVEARDFAPCLTPAKGFLPFANPRGASGKIFWKHYEVISLDIAVFGLDTSDHYRAISILINYAYFWNNQILAFDRKPV